MFVMTKIDGGKEYPIDSIEDAMDFGYFIKKCPFVYRGKKNYFWDYFKFKKTDDGKIQLTFLEFMNLKQNLHLKHYALEMLSSLLLNYNISLIGFDIAIQVSKIMQKDFGQKVVERIIFPNELKAECLATERKEIEIDIPFSLGEIIWLVQNCKVIDSPSDYLPIVLPTQQIESVILA